MKVAIYTEDTYAPSFIRKLIHRLEKEYIINKIEFVRIHTPGYIEKCHNVGNKVKTVVKDTDRIIILIDKEDLNYDENKEIWRHLKNLKDEDKKKIFVISTQPEIEEWICRSKNFSFDETGMNKEDKPSKILERKENYKKKTLPKYADEIDIGKLLETSESFREFVKALSPKNYF